MPAVSGYTCIQIKITNFGFFLDYNYYYTSGADPDIFSGEGCKHFLRRKAAAPGRPHKVRHPVSAKIRGVCPCRYKNKRAPLNPPLNFEHVDVKSSSQSF